MENTMELDELKAAWQTLDRRLQQRNAIDLELARERKLGRMRASLRPLFLGQVLQMLFGLFWVVLAVPYWSLHLEHPLLFTMGIIVHAYGVACIMLAGITLGKVGRIDPTQPLVAVQKRMATLRRTYIINGTVTGLSWWLFWMPATTVIFGWLGAVQTGLTALFYLPGTLLGIAGLLATWWFHHWSRSPKRPRLAKAMESSVIGNSLQKAQRLLDEIREFEQG